MQKHQLNPDGLSFVADVRDQSKPARIGDVLESARKSAKYYEIIRDEDGKMCGVRCTLCPKETKTIANMLVHVNSQHVKESLYCIWCDFTTFNESTLQCHVKKKHNYKKVKCEVAGCNYSSIEKGKFQRHSESHQSVLSSDQAGLVTNKIFIYSLFTTKIGLKSNKVAPGGVFFVVTEEI